MKISKRNKKFYMNPQAEQIGDTGLPDPTTMQQLRTLCRLYRIPPSPDQRLNDLNEFIVPFEQQYAKDAQRLLSVIPDQVTLSAITEAMKSLRTYWANFDMLSKNHLIDYFEHRMGEIEDTFHTLIAQLNKENETNATLQAKIDAMNDTQESSTLQQKIAELKEICASQQEDLNERDARIEDLLYAMRQARMKMPHPKLYSSVTICVRHTKFFAEEEGIEAVLNEKSLRTMVNRRLKNSSRNIKPSPRQGREVFYPLDEIVKAIKRYVDKVDCEELREYLKGVSCTPPNFELHKEIETPEAEQNRKLCKKIFRYCRDLPQKSVDAVFLYAKSLKEEIESLPPKERKAMYSDM